MIIIAVNPIEQVAFILVLHLIAAKEVKKLIALAA
jgi:hypothetical protein